MQILPIPTLEREMDYLTDVEVLTRAADRITLSNDWCEDCRVISSKSRVWGKHPAGFALELGKQAKQDFEALKESHKSKWQTYRQTRDAYRLLRELQSPRAIHTPESFSVSYDNFVQVAVAAERRKLLYESYSTLWNGKAIALVDPNKTTTLGDWMKQQKNRVPSVYVVTELGLELLNNPSEIEYFLADHNGKHDTINRLRAALRESEARRREGL